MMVLIFTSVQTFANRCDWQNWQQFKTSYIVEGGRVLDGSDKRRITTSEGQSYALFFALVANDKKTFEQLFNWTEQHLFKGDITARLPAWLWGKRENGQYGILDTNSAADSDLWIAYTLYEAGRLWGNYNYQSLGFLLAQRILREETVVTADHQLMLLPAVRGFITNDSVYKLNPSYVPIQLLEYFSRVFNQQEWQKLRQGSVKLITASLGHGYSPDWIDYQNGKFFHMQNKQGVGSYNAIRTYLWAGMLSSEDSHYNELLENLKPMQKLVRKLGYPPQEINTVTGSYEGIGSAGFSAAVAPLLSAMGDVELAQQQYLRAQQGINSASNRDYYDNVLTLFGTGWMEDRYKFSADGSLVTQWGTMCQ